MRIDLNADVGESFGRYVLGEDSAVLDVVTSANVACGFHAGDPGVMRATIQLARERGVAVGAHPGFPDLSGFGRRELGASPREVEDLVVYQIGALAAIASVEDVRLGHVKPHGALYNMACRDRRLADAIARAVAGVDPTLVLVGLSGSELVRAGQAAGLRVAREAFGDRGYSTEGTLLPRDAPGAVIEDAARAVDRAVALARDRVVLADTGARIAIEADTLCVHGDTPGAARIARRIRSALEDAGVTVRALDRAADDHPSAGR